MRSFQPNGASESNHSKVPPCLRRSGFAQAGLKLSRPSACSVFNWSTPFRYTSSGERLGDGQCRIPKSLPTGPLPTGRQAVPTEGGAGRRISKSLPPPKRLRAGKRNKLQQYIRVPENQDGGYQSTRISGESQTERISNPDALKP